MAITFRNSILENKIVILQLIISDVKVYQASVNQVIIGSGTGGNVSCSVSNDYLGGVSKTRMSS